MIRHAFAALLLATALEAQQPERLQKLARSGPRFGVTWLSGATVDTIRSQFDVDVLPVITQFGWQFEKQWTAFDQGPVALNELILLVGGLDQGLLLPSLTWLVGIRTPTGFEFGVGPNATASGVALAMSIGHTFNTGSLNVPVNVAIVPSRFGLRASFMTGFNVYK